MTEANLLNLTADIVSAHVSGNPVPASDLPRMIATVHAALAAVGRPLVEDAAPLVPAVPIRASVKPDSLICLDCGAKQIMLKRHLMAAHDLTVDEYRARWGLPASYPMTASNYAAVRADIAKKAGLGRGGRTRTRRRKAAR